MQAQADTATGSSTDGPSSMPSRRLGFREQMQPGLQPGLRQMAQDLCQRQMMQPGLQPPSLRQMLCQQQMQPGSFSGQGELNMGLYALRRTSYS